MAMHAVFVIFHKDINKSVIELLTTLCMMLKKKHEYSDNSCPTLKQNATHTVPSDQWSTEKTASFATRLSLKRLLSLLKKPSAAEMTHIPSSNLCQPS